MVCLTHTRLIQIDYMLDTRKDRLEVESWAFGDLEDPEAIGVEAFSGVHAVSDIDMPSGHYWLTFAMKPVSLSIVFHYLELSLTVCRPNPSHLKDEGQRSR